MTDNPSARGDPQASELARHVAGCRFADLPAAVVDKIKTFLLDSIGVGLAGSAGAKRDHIVAVAAGWGAGDEATVWLSGERLPAPSAAVVNAYQIHSLEYDCVHEGAVVHPMATLLASLLAYSERRAARGRPVAGRDFLLALALGVDVAAALGMAATGPIRFFRPATCGGFGAAAALAKLEGFDRHRVQSVFGALYGQTSGTLQAHVEGSLMLGLQIGFNARAALSALDLVAAGVDGPLEVLSGQYGYFRLFEDDQFDPEPVWAELGRTWQVTELAHKPFPSGRLTHGAIDALTRLQTEHRFGADDVTAFTARVPPLVYRLVGRPDLPDPQPNYAKLCLRYVAAAFLTRGRVEVGEFNDPEVLRDPRLHALAARIEVEQDDNPDQNALTPQHFAVALNDGARHEITLQHVFGHPRAPLTDAQNVEKFWRCVGHGRPPLPAAQGERLIQLVADLENLDDVSVLARTTVIGASP